MKSSKIIFTSILFSTVLVFMIFYNGYQILQLNEKISQLDSYVTRISRANSLKADASQISQLNKKISQIDSHILNISNTKQIDFLKKEIEQSCKIYVYNMDDVLSQIGFVENKKKFEEEVHKLSEEVAEAETKIKNIKDANVEEDFATVYLDSLKLKRNELIDNYQKQVEEMTDKINKALETVAAEKKASAIFKKSSLALTTNNVEDISADLADRIKQQ